MTVTAATPHTAPTIATFWKDWLVTSWSSDAAEMKQIDFYKLPRVASISNLDSYHGKPVLVSRECGKHQTKIPIPSPKAL